MQDGRHTLAGVHRGRARLSGEKSDRRSPFDFDLYRDLRSGQAFDSFVRLREVRRPG
jgi:hypothetical protein